MAVTRSQKISGAVLAIAVGAFVWDRSSSGSIAAGVSAPASLLVAHEPGSGGGDVGKTNLDGLWRAQLASRLSAIARAQCLDASCPEDAFATLTPWVIEKPVEVAPVAGSSQNGNKELADAFRHHHLDAVVVGRRGYANVEGQGIFVGEIFDGFTLVSVTKSSAVFGRDTARVELKLRLDSKLNHVGSMIENASPRAVDRSEKMSK
jgi:hypothetical protein